MFLPPGALLGLREQASMVAAQETVVTYFEYQANKQYPREQRRSSLATFEVIEPPDYWVTEHGEINEDDLRRFTDYAKYQ